MIFTASEDGTYRNGDWIIAHSQVGFGIDVCNITHAGKFQFRTVGQKALDNAMEWIRARPAPYQHEHADGP